MTTQSCILYDERLCHLTTSNTTVLCECICNGLETIAVFIGHALYLQRNVLGASCDTLVAARSAQRQVAGCPTQTQHKDGDGWVARFNNVTDMTFSASLNALIICDSGNHCVRMMQLTSPYTVSTVCGIPKFPGYIDGNIRLVQFNHPYGVAVADNGYDIFVTDYGNNAVRKINTKQSTVESILGKMAATTFMGEYADKVHTAMCCPTQIKLTKDNRFLLIVNSGVNSVCRLEIQPSSVKDKGRWVCVFACDKTAFVLKTCIQISKTGKCIIWRLMNANNGSDLSYMTLYNPNNGRVIFRKRMSFRPTTFLLYASPSHMWSKPGRIGTTCYALYCGRSGVSTLARVSLQLRWEILRLIFIAILKPNTGHPNTSHTFAILPLALLPLIIGFANDPFCVATDTYAC